MTSIIDDCLLGKNKFNNFLDVLKECDIKNGIDFMHFMSVIKEHCVDKGINDYEEVKRIWKEHKDSIKTATNSIKFPEYNDNLLEEFDKQFFENGQYEDYEDLRENTVFTEEVDKERLENCKDIFKGIDKLKKDIQMSNEDKLEKCIKLLQEFTNLDYNEQTQEFNEIIWKVDAFLQEIGRTIY